MNLFFIYDATHSNSDEDDPKDAILYFFPPQAYESRYSLCCQLVGVTKFLKSAFSSPSIIVLEEGQFVFCWSGKYLIVLGASSDVHANVLKRQLSFLCGIFCFYHGSINTVFKSCRNNRQKFLTTLDIAWSRYITLLQCFDNLLQLPVNPLPLSSSRKHVSIVARANRLLHMCQLNPSVIAGAVFCNSRVLSSQLTPEVSFYLTLMSNVNASAPVSNVDVSSSNFPPDIELKYVYLSQKLISSILKYNHIYVGSHVRVKKSNPRAWMPPERAVGSGSEADVDSGNCSESVQEYNKENWCSRSKTKMTTLLCEQQGLFACCAYHADLYRKTLFIAQNQNYFNCLDNFLKVSARWSEDSGMHSQGQLSRRKSLTPFGKMGGSNRTFSTNLVCDHHAHLQASEFVSDTPVMHNNLWSWSDLEFACSICISHHNQFDFKPTSVKRWNSCLHIPHRLSRITEPNASNDLGSPFRVQSHSSVKMQKNKKVKLQVLKCRSKNIKPKGNPCFQNHFSGSKVDSSSKTLDSSTGASGKFCGQLLEAEEQEKMVLFVQRCGGCTLLLLLKKKYDEKALTYLWNCGFSVLKDLQYGAEKLLENYTQMDATSYLLLYDNSHKILKEHPYYASTRFSEKLSRETIQSVQEDFVSNPNLRTMCLLSSHLSVCACHSKQHSGFYLQHDTNTRKLESLLNLSKRASKKFEKYLQTTL